MLLTVHLNDAIFKSIISVFVAPDTESVVTRTFVQKRALKLQFEESWNRNFIDNSEGMIAKLNRGQKQSKCLFLLSYQICIVVLPNDKMVCDNHTEPDYNEHGIFVKVGVFYRLWF